jgi:hypothetical protein
MKLHMEGSQVHLQAHLTDEQFTGLLMGENPPAVREHLNLCLQCSQEAERVSGAIGNFERQSRLWAELRAASLPAIQAPARRPGLAWLHLPSGAQALTAGAFAIVLGVGIGVDVSIHKDHVRPVQKQAVARIAPVEPAAPVQPAAPVITASLKADNELLSAIDGELRADESASDGLYGLTVASHGTRSRTSKRVAD